MLAAALVVAAYLLGSICFGIVLARRAGVELREVGSGNVGATNAGRALGATAGFAVMAFDLIKGVVPVAVAVALAQPPAVLAAVGVAAVLGHIFPIYFRFRGGKGAATAAGVLLAIDWRLGVAALVTFALLRGVSGRASVGSLGAGLAALVTGLVIDPRSVATGLASILMGILLLTHRENLQRLARGEEPRA